MLAVQCMAKRVADRVLLMDERRPAAVLEVVDPALAHGSVLDLPEVDPDVGELVGEERSRVEVLLPVDLLPRIGRRPRGIGAGRDRMRRRGEGEHVEQERFVVALPAVRQESAFRLPAMGESQATVQGPLPVDALPDPAHELPDPTLRLGRSIEVHGRREGAGDEKGAVDRRELTSPCAPPRLHVEEVVEEPSVSARVRLLSLGSVPEELERRRRPGGPPPLDRGTLARRPRGRRRARGRRRRCSQASPRPSCRR